MSESDKAFGEYAKLWRDNVRLVIDERLKESGLISPPATSTDNPTREDLLKGREKMREAMKRLIKEWDMLPYFFRSHDWMPDSFIRAITDIQHLSG